MVKLFIDFETRSKMDLKKCGTYRYAEDDSTKVLCFSWAFDDADPALWTPGHELPRIVVDHVLHDGMVYAWHAAFERQIWNKVFAPGKTWDLKIEQMYCLAAESRVNAYPGNLDDAGRALDIETKKDKKGQILMRLLSNAHAPEPTFAEICRLGLYCVDDVKAERDVHKRMRPLDVEELQCYWDNEHINDRGIAVDRHLAHAIQGAGRVEKEALDLEMDTATAGKVTATTQVKRITEWVRSRGIEMDSLAKDRLTAVLEHEDTTADIAKVLRLRQQGAFTAHSKAEAALARMSDDGRLRGMFVFAGAGQTGRFSGGGVQPHNLPRDVPPGTGLAVEMLLDHDPRRELQIMYGDVMKFLSRMIRPMLIPKLGHEFYIGDWRQIEARGLAWLAGAKSELAAYERGIDRYAEDARDVYGVQVITPSMRQVGKVCRLALGFAGGVGAFQTMARGYDVTIGDTSAKVIVDRWRDSNPWATNFWADIEQAAVGAMNHPDEVYPVGKVAYCFSSGSLWCRLPSGRVLRYPEARIEEVMKPYGPDFEITALKAIYKPKKGVKEWPRVTLWKGILVENITQATCADILRDALRRLTKHRWPIVLHVHDEIVVEMSKDVGTSPGVFKSRLEEVPVWAEGFPLEAEVTVAGRYRK